jgi:integrase
MTNFKKDELENGVSPGDRHLRYIEQARDLAAQVLEISDEEKHDLDELELVRWFVYHWSENNEKNAIHYWAALYWLCNKNSFSQRSIQSKLASDILLKCKIKLPSQIIAESTREGYERAIKAMHKWSKNKHSVKNSDSKIKIDQLQVTLDMLNRQDLNPTTKIYYRSALLWYMRQIENKTDRIKLAISELEKDSNTRVKTKRSQGKLVSENDFQMLLEHLRKSVNRSPVAESTYVWIQAAMATGLRPIEWRDAKWSDTENSTLIVITAKVKQGKVGFLEDSEADVYEELALKKGLQRKVKLLTEDDQHCVEKMQKMIKEALSKAKSQADREKTFDALYRSVKQKLLNTCKAVFEGKKNYSLYAFRRQFAANAKALLGSAVTAELMGHSSVTSPSTGHYGKGSQAHSRFKGQRPAQLVEVAQQSQSFRQLRIRNAS